MTETTFDSLTSDPHSESAATIDAELTEFRHRVRAEVLHQHQIGEWCRPGTQEVLSDLDLEPIAMTWRGTAEVRVRIHAVAGASEISEAENRVIQGLDVTCSDPDIEFELQWVSADVDEVEVTEE